MIKMYRFVFQMKQFVNEKIVFAFSVTKFIQAIIIFSVIVIFSTNAANATDSSNSKKICLSVYQNNRSSVFSKLSHVDQSKLLEIENSILALYRRFGKLSPKTYFGFVNYHLSLIENGLSPELKSLVDNFRFRNKLPRYIGSNSYRLTKGDQRRIREFNESYRNLQEQQNEQTLTTNLAKHEVILVAGFGNEFYRKNYFNDMKNDLVSDFSVPKEQVHIFFPDSFMDSEMTSKDLYHFVRERVRLTGRKVILVGHSMGGNVALDMLLMHPEMTEAGSIRKLVTIQSPLKGTEVASKIVDKVGWLLSFLDRDDGLLSMLPSYTENLVKTQLSTFTDKQRALLDEMVYYVSSHTDSEPTKIGSHIIETANDGTVPLSSQFIRGFGRILAMLPNIGHTDLVLSGSKSGLTRQERRDYTKVLFTQIINPKSEFDDGFELDEKDLGIVSRYQMDSVTVGAP